LTGALPLILMGIWIKAAEDGTLGMTSPELAKYFLAVFLVRQFTAAISPAKSIGGSISWLPFSRGALRFANRGDQSDHKNGSAAQGTSSPVCSPRRIS
jgi:hypothetical protein